MIVPKIKKQQQQFAASTCGGASRAYARVTVVVKEKESYNCCYATPKTL
jgi:hypothetical protein